MDFVIWFFWSRLVLIGLNSFRQMCFPTFEYLGCLGILGAISSNYFTVHVFGLCFAWTFATVCCGDLWRTMVIVIFWRRGYLQAIDPSLWKWSWFTPLSRRRFRPLFFHLENRSTLAPSCTIEGSLPGFQRSKRLAESRSFSHSSLFPTSLCAVLVFRFAPAAPSASARRVRPTHHHSSHTSHIQSHPTHHTAQLITTLRLAGAALTRPHHTALITAQLITPLFTAQLITPLVTAQLITPLLGRGWLLCGMRDTQSLLEELVRASGLGRGWLSCGRRSTQSLLEELVRAWAPLGRGWLSCGRHSTQSLLQELLRAWSPLARGWLPCGRRGTQSLLEELLEELLRAWAFCVASVALGDIDLRFAWQAWHLVTSTLQAGPSLSNTTLSHTQLCHAQSFTSLSHMQLYRKQLCQTQLFRTTFSHTSLSHTTLSPTALSHTHNFVTHNFVTHKFVTHTHNFVTHNFVTHNLSHTSLSHATSLWHTSLSHTTLSLTHNFVTHNSFTHNFIQLCHRQSFTHNFVTRNLSHTTLSHTCSETFYRITDVECIARAKTLQLNLTGMVWWLEVRNCARKSFYVLARRIYLFWCSSVRLRKPYSSLKTVGKPTCRFLA